MGHTDYEKRLFVMALQICLSGIALKYSTSEDKPSISPMPRTQPIMSLNTDYSPVVYFLSGSIFFNNAAISSCIRLRCAGPTNA